MSFEEAWKEYGDVLGRVDTGDEREGDRFRLRQLRIQYPEINKKMRDAFWEAVKE